MSGSCHQPYVPGFANAAMHLYLVKLEEEHFSQSVNFNKIFYSR